MGCCLNSYQVCDPLPACMETLTIVLPFDYTGEEITVSITTYGNSYKVTAPIIEADEGKYIVLDVLTDFASGFFNAYKPEYLVSFVEQPTFTGPDGKQYDSISVTVQNVIGEDEGIINIFEINLTQTVNTNINPVAIALNEQQNQQDELTFLQALQNQ